mgnify:CR=1 FL=1
MPRRKSLTRRLIQHLLLISLARTILTAIGRGRAWDDWDERKLQTEPAEPRKHTRRFVQTLSFCSIFCAGPRAFRGRRQRRLLAAREDAANPAATGATGASGASGATGVAGKTSAAQSVVHVVQAEPQAAARPTVVPARVTAKAAATAVSRPVASSTDSAKKRRGHEDTRRASRAGQADEAELEAALEAEAKRPEGTGARPRGGSVPVGDGVAEPFRARPDPAGRPAEGGLRPPAGCALAHRARRLGARAGDAAGRGPQRPRPGRFVRARALALKLAGFGGRANPWAATLAYSGDTSLADRVVAPATTTAQSGSRAWSTACSRRRPTCMTACCHDQRLQIYPGGRQDVAKGHVDVRVLALMLYLAETYHAGDGLVPHQRPPPVRAAGRRLGAHLRAGRRHRGPARGLDLRAPGARRDHGAGRPQHPDAARRNAPRAGDLLLGMGGPSFALANHYDHIHVGY